MRNPEYLDTLRVRLRAVIAYRDAYGLSDAVADALNDLEDRISREERRLSRRTARPSWLSPIVVPRWFGAGSEVRSTWRVA